MHPRVKLPPGSLIDYWVFCKAIAEAVYPTGENGLKGINCVIEKLATSYTPIPDSSTSQALDSSWASRSASASDDGGTLNEPSVPERQAQLSVDGSGPELDVGLPFDLTDADRRELSEILRDLPPLRYPMPEAEVTFFKKAYANHPRRPMWMPVLVTDATIARRKAEQAAVLARHQKAIQQAVHAGRIVPLSATHIPIAVLSVGAFLSRVHATKYLDEHGLAYEFDLTDHTDKEGIGRDQTMVGASGAEGVKFEKTQVVGREVHSQEEKEAAVVLYWQRKGRGEHAFAAKTAQEFGVGVRTLNIWKTELKHLAPAEKKRPATSVFDTEGRR